MAIPEEVIEQVKSRLDIVQVVSEYLTLKKAGRNMRAVCPFHPDSDPSLIVSPERQTFHCFGCGEGGGPIHFVMRITGMAFPEAVRYLAERVGVEVPETRAGAEARSEREGMLSLNQEAQRHYAANLAEGAAGAAARRYLERRGIGAEPIRRFGLGYARNEWEGLVRHLKGKGAPLPVAERLGLIGPSRRGTMVDKFRNRITIPIRDLQGRVIGFGGRALGDEDPKYLNSPDSILYHKGRILYGLERARDHIRSKGRAVVVEGYFDALSLAENGFGEVVATCGTALTEDHARLLGRYTERIVLLFDGDAAGRRAAWRTMELFLDKAIQPYVVLLPEEHDPDSYVRELGPGSLAGLIDSAEPILERFIRNRVAEAGADIEGKVRASQRIGQVLSRVADPARRELLVRMAAEALGVAESAVLEQVRAYKVVAPESAPGPEKDSAGARAPMEEALLLALSVRDPSLIEEVCDAGLIELMTDPVTREAMALLAEDREAALSGRFQDILSSVDSQALARALAGAILGELAIEPEQVREAYYDCERKIRLAHLRRRARAVADELARVAGDPGRERELLMEKLAIDRQIREIDGGEISAFRA